MNNIEIKLLSHQLNVLIQSLDQITECMVKKPHNFEKSMTEDQKIKISNTRKERNVAKGKNNPMYGKNAWEIMRSRKTPEEIEAIRKSKSEKMKEFHKRRREGGV